MLWIKDIHNPQSNGQRAESNDEVNGLLKWIKFFHSLLKIGEDFHLLLGSPPSLLKKRLLTLHVC